MKNELSNEEIQKIVMAERPGFVVEISDDQEDESMDHSSHAQARAPDLDYLKAKFLRGSHPKKGKVSFDDTESNASRIVRIRPAGTEGVDSEEPGVSKVVVISAKDKKIIAEQG
ncbi:hypothetical protein [Gimesia chilikensis]|uniref:hypothetical protein n=1 Tax=Gimesia chilikensis TaxID=2605989 RepID=UPI003A93673A